MQSEACQEELAYALDRAIRTRGQDFPLIGIFPEPADRAIIPSAIATRLWVSLDDPEWAQRVAAGVTGHSISSERPAIEPYILRTHRQNDDLFIEVAPRIGVWSPFVAFVPIAERDLLTGILVGPPGSVPSMSVVQGMRQGPDQHHENFFIQIGTDVTSRRSAFVKLKAAPSKFGFGQAPKPVFIHPNPADLFR